MRYKKKNGVSKIGSSNLKERYGEGWKDFRVAIKKENGFICSQCGIGHSFENPIHLHHIIPVSKGGTNSKSNLISLCKICHNKEHKHMSKK